MKNRKYLALLSLLLALVMALSACGAPDAVEDTPVTAEAKFANFISIVDYKDDPLVNVNRVTETYGRPIATNENTAIFYKEAKDKLNNLTETYTLYSVDEGKELLTITNSYKDEYGWLNDFGHMTYPEKELASVDFDTTKGVTYIVVEWAHRTPIDEEIVEEERLDDSYVVKYSYDYYDVNGKFIATSIGKDSCSSVDASTSYTRLKFGKTVATFDADDNLLSTYDGDTAAAPVLYDYSNDTYDYLLNLPNGVTDGSVAMCRQTIKVFDKKGELVLDYAHGDYAFYCMPYILDSGDILLQQLVLTEDPDCDYIERDEKTGDTYYNVDSFILDVETGVVTALENFPYALEKVMDADAFVEFAGDGFAATANVRNVANAYNYETDEDCTIFFDNFGTVNYTFDGVFCYEMNTANSVVVLDEDHLLVTLKSGTAEKAIIGKDGKVITYVPAGATVLKDYIVTDDGVYDLNMKKIHDRHSWDSQYDEGSLTVLRSFGNCVIYSATKTATFTDLPDEVTSYVIVYDAIYNGKYEYKNATLAYSSSATDMGGWAVISTNTDGDKAICRVVNGRGEVKLTTTEAKGFKCLRLDDGLILSVDIEGDDVIDDTYLFTGGAVNDYDGDYNGDDEFGKE